VKKLNKLLIPLIILTVALLPSCGHSSDSGSDSPKAAIVDQLCLLDANPAFMDEVKGALEDYGFEVDVYQGDEVTVELYRNLPSYGYKLIVFRAHAGLMRKEGSSVTPEMTFLFTGEKSSKLKYPVEQLIERIVPANMTADYPPVFAVNSEFVTKSMNGEFDNTVIIMTGCTCLKYSDLADGFVAKGASAYIGFDASVLLDYSDESSAYLVQQLCSGNVTIEEAVERTMADKGRDPQWGARLRYWPVETANETLRTLI
jgi:hypothetical protein